MVESIPAEILTLIYVGIASTIGIITLYKFSDVLKTRIKNTTVREKRDKETSTDVDAQLQNFLQNAPRLLTEIRSEIEEQRSKNVTDEQMKGLISKSKMIEFVVQNKELIDIIGKPILKKVIGMIKAI